MAISINSNITALSALRRLDEAVQGQSAAFERLSTGLRINRASDDAAGLSIAMTLQSDARITNQAIRNVSDGISVLAIAQGGLAQLSLITQRQIELAEQAANGVYSTTQRNALQAEANALAAEYNRVISTTSFNGVKLLDGSRQSLTLQAGQGAQAILSISTVAKLSESIGTREFADTFVPTAVAGTGVLDSVQADFDEDGYLDTAVAEYIGNASTRLRITYGDTGETLYYDEPTGASEDLVGLSAVDVDGDGALDLHFRDAGGGYWYLRNIAATGSVAQSADFSTAQKARLRLDQQRKVLSVINSQIGSLGAFESRLNVALANLTTTRENYLAAAGRITDVDIAAESAELVRRSILTQTGAAVLAQANQSPALALQLLEGI